MYHVFHRATYLAGELLCSVKDMIQFTAVLCQICKGDMDDKLVCVINVTIQRPISDVVAICITFLRDHFTSVIRESMHNKNELFVVWFTPLIPVGLSANLYP